MLRVSKTAMVTFRLFFWFVDPWICYDKFVLITITEHLLHVAITLFPCIYLVTFRGQICRCHTHIGNF